LVPRFALASYFRGFRRFPGDINPRHDTNCFDLRGSEQRSRAAGAEVLLAASGIVSVHAVNEFAAVARRKLSMSWRDAIIGDNEAGTSKFYMATGNESYVSLSGFSRFVITRGSAHCFPPSVTGLGCLAAQSF
jgi:hypothetical protein